MWLEKSEEDLCVIRMTESFVGVFVVGKRMRLKNGPC